ncbi:hypothetical protein [Brevundimonas balnearis]|uniref:Secreted protein n=1 Tax=Brevundimonas balnearis TaxID=1572858 RepID=A0ABV6R2H3_9CAUL
MKTVVVKSLFLVTAINRLPQFQMTLLASTRLAADETMGLDNATLAAAAATPSDCGHDATGFRRLYHNRNIFVARLHSSHGVAWVAA